MIKLKCVQQNITWNTTMILRSGLILSCSRLRVTALRLSIGSRWWQVEVMDFRKFSSHYCRLKETVGSLLPRVYRKDPD